MAGICPYRHLAPLGAALMSLGVAGALSPCPVGDVPDYAYCTAVTLEIGDLIRSGRAQPAAAIQIDERQTGAWLLRTPSGPPDLRWYRDLLNATSGAPDLSIDLGLTGTYDIYAHVRAVDAGGGTPAATTLSALLPMAFELALDDGSAREVIGARGFADHHYDTRILACHAWRLDGRKLVLHSLGQPVYLYALECVPTVTAQNNAPIGTVRRRIAQDHVTIARDDDKHFAFPGVARLRNGDLVVVYREGTVHEVEPTGKVSLSRSRDGGRTWEPRVTVLDRPRIDDRDPSVFAMSDGTVILTAADCLSTSSDMGRTWSSPLPTPVFGPRGPVEDEEGNIVYGGLQRVLQHNFTKIGSRSAVLQADAVFRSTDRGVSWRQAGIGTYTLYMPGPLDYIWYDEPFMCVIPNRYWVFTARVDLDGFARIIRSPDRGKTWEPVIKTPVWGYPQHLLPLRDGRLLMSYGYRRAPAGVRVCLSNDDGATWDLANEIVLRQDGGTPEGQERKVIDWDLGYPVSVQLSDTTILTVYYHNTAGSNCFIAATFWDLPPR